MVVANAPSYSPHVHAEMIKAWADGYEIEFRNQKYEWVSVKENPAWYPNLQYRIKPKPPANKVMFAKVEIGSSSGLWFFDVLPDVANCKLVFDGNTNKLLEAEVIKPLEASKQASEAFESMFQGHGSLDELNRLGVR